MLKPFKITKKHIAEFSELDKSDVGLYAIKVRQEQPLMLYETKQIAQKAWLTSCPSDTEAGSD